MNKINTSDLEFFIRDIPEDGEVIQVEIELTAAKAAAELFDGLDEFKPAEEDTLEASLRMQRVGTTTIHVGGTVWATMAFHCGRCLEDRNLLVEAEVVQVLVPRARWDQLYGGTEEQELTPHDMDMQYWEGDVLNLRHMIREAILLEMPSLAVCPPSMQGPCDEVYEQSVLGPARALMPEPPPEPEVDERWSKLAELKQRQGKD
jgi:uncharacterized metal-binding protein YceD (DUF177 family)